jgi:hypothetical protein
MAHGCSEVTLAMQTRGRLDHVLANIWVACGYVERGMDVRFVDIGFEAVLMKGPRAVVVQPGERQGGSVHAEASRSEHLFVSAIPIGGYACGVTEEGLKYTGPG